LSTIQSQLLKIFNNKTGFKKMKKLLLLVVVILGMACSENWEGPTPKHCESVQIIATTWKQEDIKNCDGSPECIEQAEELYKRRVESCNLMAGR
jgi:hypothetical protein